MKRKSSETGPHPLDIAAGVRVRLRRQQVGLSQNDLARAVGLTFQQIQKYERGANRISFSRLVEICSALQCSVFELIGDLGPGGTADGSTRAIARLTQPGASEMLEVYSSIASPKSRQALLYLARRLASGQPDEKESRGRRRR